MWETWIQFLGQEVPLEKEMATHSNILAWRISRTEEPNIILNDKKIEPSRGQWFDWTLQKTKKLPEGPQGSRTCSHT